MFGYFFEPTFFILYLFCYVNIFTISSGGSVVENMISRRELLIASSCSMLSLASCKIADVFSPRANNHPGILVTTVHNFKVAEVPYDKRTNFILLYDLESGLSENFEVPNNYAHCVLIDPKRAHLALVLDYGGSVGCYVNLREKKVIRKFSSSKGHVFPGHAAWSEDGSKVFLAERSLQEKKGRVVVRDVNSFEKLTDFSSNGVGVHDIKLWKGSLLVCNTGFDYGVESNVSLLNPLDGRVVKEWRMPGSKIMPNHTQVLESGNLVVATRTADDKEPMSSQPSPIISIDTVSNEVKKIFPKKSYSEMLAGLSLTYNKSKNIWAITFRHSHLVGFFDVKSNQHIGSFYLKDDFPMGVFPDLRGDNFLVTTRAGNLFYVDSTSFKAKKAVMNQNFLKNKGLTAGAHFEIIPKSVLAKV